jgi:hypothetical protein
MNVFDFDSDFQAIYDESFGASTRFKDFFTSGRNWQIAGSVMQGIGTGQKINNNLANTYSQVQNMYNKAGSNIQQANMQDLFTHLEDQSFRTGIRKALSKQTGAFIGRGVSGGASAEAIRLSSKRSLEKQRSAKHLVGATKSMALRQQAEDLIAQGKSAVSYAKKSAKRQRIGNFLSTGINTASLFF